MGGKVGQPIPALEVVTKSASMVFQTPSLMFPQIIILALGLIGDLVSRISLITTIVTFIASIVVAGAYPSMVQAVLSGSAPSVGESMNKALARFWTLLIAAVAVSILVVLGFIAIIVPGIVLATWYAYTVPAIMLENKGVLDGMAASKAFGRDKKWSTFLVFLLVAVAVFVIFVIDTGLSFASPVLGGVVDTLLSVPLYAWISVIFTYTYLTYGPSSVPLPTTDQTRSSPDILPPVVSEPSPSSGLPPQANFCRNCGAALQPGQRFCISCGTPV
jgi:zinc ribbon protein